jgi:hypothetical protein
MMTKPNRRTLHIQTIVFLIVLTSGGCCLISVPLNALRVAAVITLNTASCVASKVPPAAWPLIFAKETELKAGQIADDTRSRLSKAELAAITDDAKRISEFIQAAPECSDENALDEILRRRLHRPRDNEPLVTIYAEMRDVAFEHAAREPSSVDEASYRLMATKYAALFLESYVETCATQDTDR